jgi:hypothetical protein
VGQEFEGIPLHAPDLAGEKGKKIHADAHDCAGLRDGPGRGAALPFASRSTCGARLGETHLPYTSAPALPGLG